MVTLAQKKARGMFQFLMAVFAAIVVGPAK
jgi:hypothetical protein